MSLTTCTRCGCTFPTAQAHFCEQLPFEDFGATPVKGILEAAQEIQKGARQQNYGKPEDNFSKIALVWSGLLRDKLKEDITAEEVACMMIGLKLCRETWQHHRDNLVDTIGYTLCLEQISERRDTGTD